MRAIQIVTTLVTYGLVTLNVLGQGGVNVKYIPLDSVDTNYLNRPVKIDFKHAVKEDSTHYWLFRDTATVLLDNKTVEIIEHKGRGVDYYYFEMEFLESKNYRPGQITRIYKCTVKEIRTDSILFQWTLQFYKKGKRKKLDNFREDNKDIVIYEGKKSIFMSEVGTIHRDIWISKRKIDGLLIKRH